MNPSPQRFRHQGDTYHGREAELERNVLHHIGAYRYHYGGGKPQRGQDATRTTVDRQR